MVGLLYIGPPNVGVRRVLRFWKAPVLGKQLLLLVVVSEDQRQFRAVSQALKQTQEVWEASFPLVHIMCVHVVVAAIW